MITSTKKDLQQFVDKFVKTDSRVDFYDALRTVFVIYASAIQRQKFATETLAKRWPSLIQRSLVEWGTVIIASDELDNEASDEIAWPLIFVSVKSGLSVIQLNETLMDELFTPNGELRGEKTEEQTCLQK